MGTDAAHRAAAARFGTLLGERGIRVVFGGGQVGLMGLLADAAMAAGGTVLGVIPNHLHEIEIGHPNVTDLRIVDNMHSRKEIMFRESDAFAILPGGSGKSTILRLLTGLFHAREARPKVSGRCVVLGENIELGYPRSLRNRVAAVLQDEGLLDDLSPRENVELALTAAGRSTKLAVALLSQTGLDEPPDRVSVLSGGMRKRAGVARGLAASPELFIFDEPTAGLDAKSARQLAELLLETHREAGDRRTTIVISHDLQAFDGIASGILEIDTDARTLHLKDPGDPEVSIEVPGVSGAAETDEHDPFWEASKRLIGELGSFSQTIGQSVVRLPAALL